MSKPGSWCRRIVVGDAYRKSRFHDYSGRAVEVAGLPYLWRSISTTMALKILNRRAEIPWLGFRALKAIGKLLTPGARVLEFGSGMSSLWLARRCESLVSYETDAEWAEEVSRRLREHRIANVDLRLSPIDETYPAADDLPERAFDFVLVDGVNRLAEARVALRKVAPGGHILMDNSDVPDDVHQQARAMLIDAAGAEGHIEVFTDFYPFYIGVNQSILVSVPVGE